MNVVAKSPAKMNESNQNIMAHNERMCGEHVSVRNKRATNATQSQIKNADKRVSGVK